MTWLRLFKAEGRKLVTTRLLWGFLGALVLFSVVVAVAVVLGSGTDDAVGFVDTSEAQRSLLAFGTITAASTSSRKRHWLVSPRTLRCRTRSAPRAVLRAANSVVPVPFRWSAGRGLAGMDVRA